MPAPCRGSRLMRSPACCSSPGMHGWWIRPTPYSSRWISTPSTPMRTSPGWPHASRALSMSTASWLPRTHVDAAWQHSCMTNSSVTHAPQAMRAWSAKSTYCLPIHLVGAAPAVGLSADRRVRVGKRKTRAIPGKIAVIGKFCVPQKRTARLLAEAGRVIVNRQRRCRDVPRTRPCRDGTSRSRPGSGTPRTGSRRCWSPHRRYR